MSPNPAYPPKTDVTTLEESTPLIPNGRTGPVQTLSVSTPTVVTTTTPLSLIPRLALMATPVPVLLMLNEALFQGQVDRLHCILFQLLVMTLVQMVYMSRLVNRPDVLASADPVLSLATQYALPRNRSSPSYIPPDRQIISSSHALPSTLVDHSLPSSTQGGKGPSLQPSADRRVDSSSTPGDKGQERNGLFVQENTEQMAESSSQDIKGKEYLSPIAKECEGLVQEFLAMANQNLETTEDWILVHTQTSPFLLQVHRHQKAAFRYRIEATIPVASGTAFDLLADPSRRTEWDDMCAYSGIVQSLSPSTNVTHVQTKPVWPTSARDLCLLSHIRRLSPKEGGGLLGVTQSTTHPDCPADPTGGVVRMHAGVAGQWVRPVKERHEAQGKESCTVLQLVEGDLKGWIPGSVVKYVATKAIPQGFIKLVKQLEEVPPPHSEDTRLLPLGYAEGPTALSSNLKGGVKEEEEGRRGSPPPSVPVINPSRSLSPGPGSGSGGSGSSSPATLSSLQFRIRRLEAQVKGLLGALPPRLAHHRPGAAHGPKTGREVGRMRRFMQGGMGIAALGAWTAAILYVLRRLR
ncbi:hypothetical protein BJ684DRAFT_19570 [Piptocephalis cylindrospora]|uniref:START domain-containing protein n=1 Tax=Piptocephalis cylindrospora TaxID=1907219 RepID=A0A4P9Y593_9FUNG|nr:hypothetical protein BJ684DRAFT_19570 [Piptocephalis cylindrospora]|eukprot:RKP13984.1 hypothetical protein BJ684DRAFT_19570 [Piptocephalis cylindrospora]